MICDVCYSTMCSFLSYHFVNAYVYDYLLCVLEIPIFTNWTRVKGTLLIVFIGV